MSERTKLAQMLWDLKERNDVSLNKLAAPAGDLLSVSTLHAVMHGNTSELTPNTIKGLALILKISQNHVLAALENKELPESELKVEEKDRLWGMYVDIPAQCQKDVMDLLEVLQRNHSISARRQRQQVRRHKVAAIADGTAIQMSEDSDVKNEVPRHPAVTDTPRDVPLPTTTPIDLSAEQAEEETWYEPRPKNGTNGNSS